MSSVECIVYTVHSTQQYLYFYGVIIKVTKSENQVSHDECPMANWTSAEIHRANRQMYKYL